MGDMFGGGGGGQDVDVTSMGYSGLSQPKTDDDLLGTYRKALSQNRNGFASTADDQSRRDQEDRLARLMGE